MEPIITRTPTAIRDFRVTLTYIANPSGDQQQRQVEYQIQVLDQNNSVEWVLSGDLIPYLDDTSSYLTTADRAVLLDFMTRVRQEAVERILG